MSRNEEIKQVFKRHRGRKVEVDGKTGVICGYTKNCENSNTLIMAVGKGFGWSESSFDTHIGVIYRGHARGYWYCEEADVLKQEVSHE